MSGRDDLKYFVVRDGKGEKPYNPIGGFKYLEDAEEFLSRQIMFADNDFGRERFPTPFTCKYDSDLPMYDILVDLTYPALFCDVFKNPVMSSFAESLNMTKAQVAEQVFNKEDRHYDYALPKQFIDKVVDALDKQNWDNPHDMRQVIHFGTVWFYPKDGQFRIPGRPAAITESAKILWTQYYSTIES